MATIYVALVCVYMCSISWLFWLSVPVQAIDWKDSLSKIIIITEFL